MKSGTLHNIHFKTVFILFTGPSTSQQCFEPVTINITANQQAGSPPLFSSTASTQTPPQLSYNTPRKRKLRSEVKSLKKKVSNVREADETMCEYTIEQFHQLCDAFLDKPLADLVKSHASLKSKKVAARRYSIEIKQFALQLYFVSPKAYNFISNLLTLPTRRSLYRMTEQLSFNPGLNNDGVFKALEIKVKAMLDQDSHCILCIDEMSLKSNVFYNISSDEIIGLEDIGNTKNDTICRNALVIMARGLYSSWKQTSRLPSSLWERN